MISKDAIGVTRLPNEDHHVGYKAGVKIENVEYRLPEQDRRFGGNMNAKMQARIWDMIYGDIERKLPEIRRRLMQSIMPHAADHHTYQAVNEAIDELVAMVLNPFR